MISISIIFKVQSIVKTCKFQQMFTLNQNAFIQRGFLVKIV